MTAKKFVIEAVKKLPEKSSYQDIREKLDLLLAIHEAEESISRGEGVSHEEVENKFDSWSQVWRSKSSGHRKQLTACVS
jgi:hypothetical protein